MAKLKTTTRTTEITIDVDNVHFIGKIREEPSFAQHAPKTHPVTDEQEVSLEQPEQNVAEHG